MNNIILITKNHHLYSILSKQSVPFYTLNTPEDIDVVEEHVNALVFDFTVFNTKDKMILLKAMPKDFKVISDFTCSWGELISEKYSQVVGSLASAFYSPKKCFEICSSDKNILDATQKFFEDIDYKTKTVTTPGHGFIMPRTVAMIINEAFFSLEDQLAEVIDIDTAMKFGVNYPLGPFEWAKKTGLTPVKLLLDDLYDVHHDKRYKLSTLLRKQESL